MRRGKRFDGSALNMPAAVVRLQSYGKYVFHDFRLCQSIFSFMDFV